MPAFFIGCNRRTIRLSQNATCNIRHPEFFGSELVPQNLSRIAGTEVHRTDNICRIKGIGGSRCIAPQYQQLVIPFVTVRCTPRFTGQVWLSLIPGILPLINLQHHPHCVFTFRICLESNGFANLKSYAAHALVGKGFF